MVAIPFGGRQLEEAGMLVGSSRPDSSPALPEGRSYGPIWVGVMRDSIGPLEMFDRRGLSEMRRDGVGGG